MRGDNQGENALQTKLPFAAEFLRIALTFVGRHLSQRLAPELEDGKLPGQSTTPTAGGRNAGQAWKPGPA
jgi:hypothetical protein